MTDEKKKEIIAILQKLKFRIENSVDDSENQNARRVLENQMKKYDISESDLINNQLKDRRLACGFDFGFDLLKQVMAVRCKINLKERNLRIYGLIKKMKIEYVIINISDDEDKLIRELFNFYADQFKKSLKKFKKRMTAELKTKRAAFDYAFLSECSLLDTNPGDQEKTDNDLLKAIYDELKKFKSDPLQNPESALSASFLQIENRS